MPLALIIVLPVVGVILLVVGIVLAVTLGGQDPAPRDHVVQKPVDNFPQQPLGPGGGPDNHGFQQPGPLVQVPLIRTIQACPTCVGGVDFSPDSATLVTADGYMRAPGQVKFWQTGTGTAVNTLLTPGAEVMGVAFSPDGTLVACASSDEGLHLCERVKRRTRARFRHPSYVRAVAFSPDGKRLASSCEKALKVWDMATLRESWSADLDASRMSAWRITLHLAFAPDGKTLAAGTGGNDLRLYDAANGRVIATCAGHTDLVLCTAYSPDGKHLASGSFDKTVKLWDPATHRVCHTLTGHTDWVFCVAFAPDGKTLASAGREGSVILWDATRGQKLTLISSHPNHAICVAFSPDGKTLASSGVDGTVKLWDVSKIVGPKVARP
jgi:WD40 repeat protein